MKDKIVLVGGGGHSRVVIDAILKKGNYSIVGVVDNDPALEEVSDQRVIGDDSSLLGIFDSGCRKAFICLGSIGNTAIRRKIFVLLKKIGFIIPVISHPGTIIGNHVEIGEGTFVAPGAVIGTGSKIGRNVIVNTNASLDHDCELGDFVHVAPGCTISGGVVIGNDTHIGLGSCIVEYKSIGANSFIGAGSIVISDMPGDSKAMGSPCKVVGRWNG